MFVDKHVTMDSFGEFCPANWEQIAAYLNDKIDSIIDSYGADAEYSRDCADDIVQVWEDYCNGKFADAPAPADVDINGIPADRF